MTLAITGVATWHALDLGLADWAAPFDYDSDAIQIAQWMQTTFLHGWYEREPLLGAPFGQNYHDWGWADHLGFLIALLLNPLTQNPYLTENLIFVGGFPAAALSSLWFFRRVGVARPFSVALAVLYAVTPYHLVRGEYHLFLGTYWPLPLVAGVSWMLLAGTPLWSLSSRRVGRVRIPSARSWFVLLVAIVVALDGVYYAFFSVALLAFASCVAAVRHRSWRRLLSGAAASAVICATVVVDVAPDVLYTRAHGQDLAALVRTPGQSEDLAVKLIELLLPVPQHRIPLLAHLRDVYTAAFPLPGENPSLGTVGAVGLVLLLIVAALAGARGALVRQELALSRTSARLADLSIVTVFLLILSTVGGLSSIVALLTSGLRGWDRVSILIQLYAFAGCGLGLGTLTKRFRRTIPGRYGAATVAVLAPALAGGLVIGGYLDQVGVAAAPDHAQVQMRFRQDAQTVAGIERVFGDHASVLQLPPRSFPESGGPVGIYDSDQLRFFLHSSTLKWSGGGIKGRPESDWVAFAGTMSLRTQLVAGASAGFSAVMLDRGYYDSATADAVQAEFEKLVGRPRVRSADGRFVIFDLRGKATRLAPQLTAAERHRIGFILTHPVEATLTQDTRLGYSFPSLFAPYRPQLQMQNPRLKPVRAIVTINGSYTGGPAVFRITQGASVVGTVHLTATTAVSTFSVTVPPGVSSLGIEQVQGAPLPASTPVIPVLPWILGASDADGEALLERVQ